MDDLNNLSDEELEKIANGKETSLDFLVHSAGLSKDVFFKAVEAAKQTAMGGPAIAQTALNQSAEPGNQQSLVNALKMQSAPGNAPIAGQAINLGVRYGPTAVASLALPGESVAVPIAARLARAGLNPLAAKLAGTAAGSLEQGIVAGGTRAGQGLLAGEGKKAIEEGVDTGATFAKYEGALGSLANIGSAMKPKAIESGAQALRTLPRIAEDIGRQALKDPSILLRAKSVEDAGKDIGLAAQKEGLKAGTEGLQESFGTRFYPGDSQKYFEMADKASSDLQAFKAKAGKATGDELSAMKQEALTTVQAINHALRFQRFQQPIAKANVRELLKTESEMSNFLSETAPAIGPALTNFREAVVKDAFSSVFPRNLNKAASVLGGLAGGGLLAKGISDRQSGKEGFFANPLEEMAAAALFSPMVAGLGIRGLAVAGKTVPGVKMGTAGLATLNKALSNREEQ